MTIGGLSLCFMIYVVYLLTLGHKVLKSRVRVQLNQSGSGDIAATAALDW